jgi:hypothetical protein
VGGAAMWCNVMFVHETDMWVLHSEWACDALGAVVPSLALVQQVLGCSGPVLSLSQDPSWQCALECLPTCLPTYVCMHCMLCLCCVHVHVCADPLLCLIVF